MIVALLTALSLATSAHAGEYPLTWRRTRTEITRVFANAFREAADTTPSAVDWRPAYDVLRRARRRASGPRRDEYLTFVVAGGVAEAARLSDADLDVGEVLRCFHTQLRIDPVHFESRALLPWLVAALGAQVTSLLTGLGGISVLLYHVVTYTIRLSHESDDFVFCLFALSTMGASMIIAPTVISADLEWTTGREAILAAACETLLADLAANPPAFAPRDDR